MAGSLYMQISLPLCSSESPYSIHCSYFIQIPFFFSCFSFSRSEEDKSSFGKRAISNALALSLEYEWALLLVEEEDESEVPLKLGALWM